MELAIVGSGGLAREVRWLIEVCNEVRPEWAQYQICGWISKEMPGSVIDGLPILGGDDWLLRRDDPICAVVAIGDGRKRKQIVNRLKANALIEFPNIIAPSAILSATVRLGRGCIIAEKCVLTVNIDIGDFFFGNLNCTVGHDCKFSDYVTLNPGTNISGNVCLDECVTIGTGASIVQGLSVGEGAFIGAGAVVTHNIDADTVAVGVPAKAAKKTGSGLQRVIPAGNR